MPEAFTCFATTDPVPCNGAPVMVLVCGLPGSGNRLLKRLFIAAGGEATVCHGNSGAKHLRSIVAEHDHRVIAVMPVRDAYANRVANPWAQTEKQRDDCTAIACHTLTEDGIPLRIVSFESLFLYPESAKDCLLEWAGLPKIPWPEGDFPRDENRKHYLKAEVA